VTVGLGDAAKRGVSVGVVLVWIAAAAACSGTSRSAVPPPTSTSDNGSSGMYSRDAMSLAGLLPGCTDVRAEPVPAGSAPGMVAIASCHLVSDIVMIYTWSGAAAELAANRTIAGPMSAWSSGPGWSQIMGDDSPAATQLSIATAVAAALHGTIYR
jgi:hypothetical protein